MIFAYRESTASLSARIVSADSPLIAPESTVDPGVFDIMYGSPVRYDSSITPCPSTTVPSIGQTSCGKTSTVSPIATSASGTSAIVESCLRCASVGIRLASASSTLEALRTAYASSVSPPESISTTSVPARYSSRSTDVTIEIPASRSEPNSRRKSFTKSSHTSGTPPSSSATHSGAFCTVVEADVPNRSTRCTTIAASANTAIAACFRRTSDS